MLSALITRPSTTSYVISNNFDLVESEKRAELPERVARDPVLDVRARKEDPAPLAKAAPEADALHAGTPLLELSMGGPTA